jgi:sialate O-acetylesterase
MGIYNYAQFSENSLNLFGKWKFRLFDDEKWSEEKLDESGWEEVIVPAKWESQGFRDYDGFAWYRKTFDLKPNFRKDDMVLLLGKIDDMDEVFINGKLIGGTGKINRKWTDGDEWSRHRTYSVPDGLLKTGNNVIAVRVYDQVGDGGIYEGPITLLPRNEYKEFWRKYKDDQWDFYHWFSNYID